MSFQDLPLFLLVVEESMKLQSKQFMEVLLSVWSMYEMYFVVKETYSELLL
jgi:hypothetical protein